MIECKESEEVQEDIEEEYDYMNEEPLDEEKSYEYEEKEDTYCD